MVRKLHYIGMAVWLVLLLANPLKAGESAGDFANSEPYFHKVEAQKGDGIYALLRRYKLDNYSCNLAKFLELNDIDQSHELQLHRDYFIPVMIYTYNGRSIRTTIADNDMEKALRIKSYNEYLQAQNLRQSSYTDSKILWVPYHELHCGSEVLQMVKEETPTSGKAGKLNRYEPLFGPKYASVPVEDESLKDRVFYVVSGHGGPDPGARCTECSNTLCEDEYAYDVALRLSRNLMQHGATVYMIIQDENDGIRDEQYLECDTDELSINKKKLPLNQKKRLKQRTEDINRLFARHKQKGTKSQVVISIHVDSRSQSRRQDVFFYHSKGSKSGKKVAEELHKTFDEKYGIFQKGRGYKGYVKERNLYVLRNTHPTAVFVELANIRNKYDHRRILLESNRQALANWLFEGLVDAVE
jgi:N-acetylmuramoyl-L-alanine amidase